MCSAGQLSINGRVMKDGIGVELVIAWKEKSWMADGIRFSGVTKAIKAG